jgi:hypothetical protein
MPPLDVAFAQTPAQPDLPAAGQRREVDEAGLDLTERHAELVDPGHAGLHLVDDALHPEAEDPDVALRLGVGWVLRTTALGRLD